MKEHDALTGNQWHQWKVKILAGDSERDEALSADIKYMILDLDFKYRSVGLTKEAIQGVIEEARKDSPYVILDSGKSDQVKLQELDDLEAIMLGAFEEALAESSVKISKRTTGLGKTT